MSKINIAILASGNGSNFEAIAIAIKKGAINANLKLLVVDNEDAYVRVRAKKFNIPDEFINPKNFNSRVDFDKTIVKILKNEKIDLVVLAGFMRILSPYFIKNFKNRILNIHPALLPAFKGTNSIKRAYDYGCKIAGVTVHFVDESVDHGPIILQEVVKISRGMTLKQLESNIHKLEHRLYPEAIKLFTENRLKISNRIVKVKNR